MPMRATYGACGIMLVLCLVAVPSAMRADELKVTVYASALPPERPLTDDERALLGRALNIDPAQLSLTAPVPTLRTRHATASNRVNVSRTEQSGGASTTVVSKSLSADWNAKIGADLNLAAPAPVTYQPDRPMPGSATPRNSGAAWASVGIVPDLATLDARVDPGSDQGRIATTFQRSLPIGDKVSVTVHDSYAVSDTLGEANSSAAAPAGLPVMTVPEQTAGAAPAPVWTSDRGVKVNIQPTGTTLSAALTSASTEPTAHNVLSAEQRLYGPLHVTTTVTDPGESNSNQSITAGLKLNW
jgi:hypothetical protein